MGLSPKIIQRQYGPYVDGFPNGPVTPPRQWLGTAVPCHRPPLLSWGGEQKYQISTLPLSQEW